MRTTRLVSGLLLAGALGLTGLSASAVTPAELQQISTPQPGQACRDSPDFRHSAGGSFSTPRMATTELRIVSYPDPAGPGRHAKTARYRVAVPLANPSGLPMPRRPKSGSAVIATTCWVRLCTAQEKGDVLAYLMSLGK